MPKTGSEPVRDANELTPSLDQLIEIRDAGFALAATARETYAVSDQVVPPGFPENPYEMVDAMRRLDNAINPKKHPFGDSLRKVFCAAGGQSVTRVVRAMSWMRELLDSIIISWKLQSQYGGDAKDVTANVPLVSLEPGEVWPPRIERDVIDSIEAAAQLLDDVISQTFPNTAEAPEPVRDAAGEQDGEVSAATLDSDKNPTACEGEWSAPMSKAEMARRITGKNNARSREVEGLLARFGLRQASKSKWVVRLDKMDAHTRRKLEK